MIEPWQIPQTWAWVESHEIAEIVGGGTPRTSDSTNFDGGDVPWITPGGPLWLQRKIHFEGGTKHHEERTR